MIYGVHLRVYYDADSKEHVRGRVATLQSGDSLGREVHLGVELQSRIRRVNQVDYLGKYEGVNWEGDGQYRRWHYFYYYGQLTHHIGSAAAAPYAVCWDTSWIPDQQQPMELAARIVDDTGLIFLTPAVSDLRLQREGLSVELCKPSDVPENWVSRRAAFSETVRIEGDVQDATAARLVWSSWSPGYMQGLFVNDQLIVQQEGPRYRYYDHRINIDDLSVLKPGDNIIRTGKTPLYDEKMVHGMEVNWPGIQLLVQYETNK